MSITMVILTGNQESSLNDGVRDLSNCSVQS